jgi:catechol 2,3-dioxygenase-like lactoylglutathione lyase family enzyme
MAAVGPATLRQVALAAGTNLDATLAFWDAMLGLPTHARFDPPGIAFIYAGQVRLFFSLGSTPGTVYLDVPDVDALHADLTDRGVAFDSPPALLHTDTDGTFGPAGESEWMAFLKDPAGNTIGLVTRRS